MINVKKPAGKELSEEEKQKQMLSFMDKYEKEIKEFGMLKDYGARWGEREKEGGRGGETERILICSSYSRSSDYLRDHPHLVCADTSNYLTMWCVNLEVQEVGARWWRPLPIQILVYTTMYLLCDYCSDDHYLPFIYMYM